MEQPSRLRFDKWKKAVGFPEIFPRLRVLAFDQAPEDETLYASEELLEKRTELLQRLQGGHLRVVVPVGHGATTLARWVVQQVQQNCLTMRMIPVLVTLDDMVDHDAALKKLREIAQERSLNFNEDPADYVEGYTDSPMHVRIDAKSKVQRRRLVMTAMAHADEVTEAAMRQIEPTKAIDRAVHTAVARSLAGYRWERVVGDYAYAELLGAENTDAKNLQARAREIEVLVNPAGDGQVEWEAVGALSIGISDPVTLSKFLRDNGIRVSIHLDLSCTRYGRLTIRDAIPHDSEDIETNWFKQFVIEQFLTYVKNVDDTSEGLLGSWTGGGTNSTIGVVEYLSADTNARFTGLYTTGHSRVDTAAFDALDVFAVLASHYPLGKTNRDRPELVSAVLYSGLIEDVTRSDMAITSMIRLLEDNLKELQHISYQAQPRWLQNLPDELGQMQVGLSRVQEDMAVMQGEVAELNEEVATLQGGLSQTSAHVNDIQADIKRMKKRGGA